MRLRAGSAQLPALTVLVVVGTGLGVAAQHHWRAGTGLIGLALLLAAGLRLTLPPRVAGWLVVRSRVVDALLLLLAGFAMIALTLTIPHP